MNIKMYSKRVLCRYYTIGVGEICNINKGSNTFTWLTGNMTTQCSNKRISFNDVNIIYYQNVNDFGKCFKPLGHLLPDFDRIYNY